jgi:hypothetical protein
MDAAPMSPVRWISYCWPGLPQLWQQGSWAGLAAALGWGLLANWLLAATFVWTEVAHALLTQVGWAMLAASWVAGVGLAIRWNWQCDTALKDPQTTDLLRAAQVEYLRGNWLVAEGQLKDILAIDSSDVEVQLMLVSLYRHTERKSKADEYLRGVQRLAAAQDWKYEIETEQRLLNEIEASDVVATDGTFDDGTSTLDEQPITQNAIDRNNTDRDQQQPAAA